MDVLIIESDGEFAGQICEALAAQGVSAAVFPDGEEALRHGPAECHRLLLTKGWSA